MKALALCALGVTLAACGPSSSSSSSGELRFATPQALSACAAPPADLQARLWISGTSGPCALEVDVEQGTTSGACDVAPGIVRRFTLDWFVVIGVIGDGDREVVLAQAQQDVDLAGEVQAEITLSIADDDVDSESCFDMSVDPFNGRETVDVDGVARPVCDLDGDGEDNLAEVCAGGDPLGGA